MPDSVGHHCYFISQPTKALQLKKGLNFKINNINKISTDCNDCGTLYVFWLLNYIYKLLNFLKTRTLIPSKQNRESQKKRYSRKILAIETIAHRQTKREEGHLISGYHSPEMSASQRSGKAGIQCLHEYPIFHFLFQLNDKRAFWARLHMIPVICIIILSLNSRPEKKSGPEILEIR